MHELSLAEALVREASGAARESAAGRRVTEVHVEVGELSGAVPEMLADCFDMAAEGGALAGARLVVKRLAAAMRCASCGAEFRPGASVGCPECGSSDVDLLRGREIRLVALEIEDGDEAEDGA